MRELITFTAAPLPPTRASVRAVRYLPHTLTVVLAILLYLAGEGELRDPHHVAAATAVAAAEAAALVLALYAPVPAWWCSIASCAAAALLLHDAPWSWPAMLAHTGVLFLLSLRVRASTALLALGISAAATLVLPLIGSGDVPRTPYEIYRDVALGVFTAAVLVGTILRSRREAHAEALRQAAATAAERARRTVLEERSRIARELHDVIAHHMSVISIQAQVASRLLEDPPPELLENLAGIRGNAVEALGELRSVLALLRTEDSEDDAPYAPQPTLAELDRLTDTVRGTGTTVSTETTGTPRPLAPGVELSAYRIIQEALSNALRHAPGAAVKLRLDYSSAELAIEVTNTAPAQPVPPSHGAGLGLLGMRERTAMLGGHLTAQPTPDGGYTLTATLPATPAPNGSQHRPQE
ncbi:sensor histidine kinase [Streptomyces sp. NPDC056519]|uniref:sensor histidine kinase n=1 Tax=Streptomyces sp. NPDC056519 TaxID=3345849 RepID=UPI0036C7DE34